MPARRLTALVLAGSLVAGCGQLLPRQSSSTQSSFQDFESARRALDRAVPFKTSVDDLRTLGFDVHDSANVTLIPYPELVSRLAPNPSVPLSELDAGIRECILSRMACQAFEFELGRQLRQREGGFWGDFLNFRRTTAVSGWRFKALVVVRDGLVLFRNYGGEPKIVRTEKQVNPLGPFQPAGEAAAGRIAK
jgi:hypothetical protein